MFGRVGNADGVAHVVGAADEGAQLQLDVQPSGRGEDRAFGLGGGGGGVRQDLAPGAADRGAGDDDGGGAAVVGDGEVGVVWLEGVGGAAEEDADVVGVVEAGVKVGVVADVQGEVGGDVVEGDQSLLLEGVVRLEELWVGRVGGEDALDVLSDVAVDGTAEGCEGV